MRRNKKSLWSSLPMSIILSVTIGLAAAVGLGCVFSALVYLVLRDMGLSNVLAALSLAAGAYMGSYMCGRYRRHRGAVSGIICGAVMFAVIFLAGLALQVDAADIKKLLLLAVSGCMIIPHSRKHQSAGRKTSIRGKENANPHKERSNSRKERTSCII